MQLYNFANLQLCNIAGLLDRPAGRTSSLYLKPWPFRIFKDWPFSFRVRRRPCFCMHEGLCLVHNYVQQVHEFLLMVHHNLMSLSFKFRPWRSKLLLRRYLRNDFYFPLNFQCIFNIFTVMHLKSLWTWIITKRLMIFSKLQDESKYWTIKMTWFQSSYFDYF